jgi:hypothetical protein
MVIPDLNKKMAHAGTNPSENIPNNVLAINPNTSDDEELEGSVLSEEPWNKRKVSQPHMTPAVRVYVKRPRINTSFATHQSPIKRFKSTHLSNCPSNNKHEAVLNNSNNIGPLGNFSELDISSLVNPEKYLNDDVINAAVNMMMRQANSEHGTEFNCIHTEMLANANFLKREKELNKRRDKTSKIIQVVNVRENHWAVLTNVGTTDSHTMILYDSLISHTINKRMEIPSALVSYAASLLQASHSYIIIKIANILEQVSVNLYNN